MKHRAYHRKRRLKIGYIVNTLYTENVSISKNKYRTKNTNYSNLYTVYTLHTTCHQFSRSPPFLWTHSCIIILYYTQNCHSQLTNVILHKDEVMGHKYCLSMTRHFEGQLLNFFYFLTQWQYRYVSVKIYIYIFLLYTAITICKNFMKYQIVKNPGTLTD